MPASGKLGGPPESRTPASGADGPQTFDAALQTPDAQTSMPTSAVHFDRLAGDVGSGSPFAICIWHVPEPASAAVQYSPAPQSVLRAHTVPHAPLTVSQIVPRCPLPLQSGLFVHLLQPPVGSQYGAAAVGHAAAPVVPRSPVHSVQSPAPVSQIGTEPLQTTAFVDEHSTHAFVVGEHAGVDPLHWASVAHGSHLPAFGPVAGHAPERHAVAPVAAVHGSPFAMPHLSSVVSQTPDTQARAPSAAVHVPPGTASPFGTSAWQTPTPASPRSSHQCPAPQIASLLHVEPHAPVATSQRGPACPLPQSASEVHCPHVPAAWQ